MVEEKYMDLTVNPGTDFYKYANGHWLDYNKQKPEYASWGNFSVLTETNIKRIAKLIKKNDGSIMSQKISDFYNICMDWKRRNDEGCQPLLKYLNDNIYSINDHDELIKWCAINHMLPFFHIYISPDRKNANMNAVSVSQSGLSLGNKEYYLSKDKNTKKIVSAWKKYCISLYMAIGKTKEEATAKYKTIWKIEKSLAKRFFSVEESRDPELTYHKKKVSSVSKSYHIDFDSILKNYGYYDTDEVIIKQEKPIKYGCKMMNELSIEDLKTIIEWQIIDYASTKLSDDFSKIAFKLNKAMSGVKKRTPKEKAAISITDSIFGEVIGQLYVKKYFKERSKIDVLRLINELKESFKDIICEKEWLSNETKQKAIDKLDALRVKIGYPDKIEDYSDCPVDPEKTYFENRLAISEYFIRKDTEKNYNKPVDKDEWLMYPQDINAYYNPTTNEICFPAGILQSPFYDYKYSAASNFGSIGVVIGHEMTHGYDNHGRQFDINGNHNTWWKEDEIEKFNELTKNTVDRFNNIDVLPGLKGNGTLTLGENLADYGGLKIAYNACKKHYGKETGWEKDFFISYANAWAGISSDEQVRNQTLNDPHSVRYVRVNGTLPMFDAWYDAFDITEKDEMYISPDKRAMLW